MTKSLLAAFAVAGAAALAAVPARAAVTLMVNSTTIADNGLGDVDPNLGQITYIAPIPSVTAAPPGFALTVDTGTTTSLPSIDLNSVDITSTAAATIVVMFTETNLNNPAKWLTQFTGSWTGGSASVRLQTYLDPGNTPFGTGVTLADLTAASTLFSLSASASSGFSGPFSVTEVLTITADAAGEHFSLDGQLSDAPEPASLALLGVGLTGLAWFRRRNSRA
jgi:PEP-CTERM motif